jgi:hypothetical protein
VAFVEQAFYDVVGAAGWDLGAQNAAGGRLRALHHDLEYLDAALYGETIAVTTWIVSVVHGEVTQHTHLHRGDPRRPLLQARSRYGWSSDAGEPLPSALRMALQPA